MKFVNTEIAGVQVLIPRRFSDSRGHFSETWNATAMCDAGLDLNFVQDNHSFSRQRGTVRGLHFQAPPHAQDKLIRVAVGRIVDVAVDVRRGSPTFGNWVSCELSAENGRQLLVPKGFLHGFATLEDDTVVLYKTTDFYAPQSEGAVRFDDPDLAIDWGIEGLEPLLSEKDARAPAFAEFDSPFMVGDAG